MAEGIGGRPDMFLTLTIRSNDHGDPIAAAKRLSRAWRLLRLRIMRSMKWKQLPFLAVFERHLSGWPHLHIMLRSKYIPQKWLSDQMLDLIDSPHVDVRRIRDHKQAVAYVAKYTGKDCHKFGTCKRYWQSKDYDLRQQPPEKPKPKYGEGWERENVTLQQWSRNFKLLGWVVTFDAAWRASARDPTRERPP